MIKLLTELSTDELKKVLNNNHKLQYDVFDDMQDNEMFWIDESLKYLKNSLSSWSIGFNDRNFHITINHGSGFDFIHDVERLQNDMCFLSDGNIARFRNIVEDYTKLNVKLQDLEYDNDKYNETEEEVNNLIEAMEDIIILQFKRQLESILDDDYQLDYFSDFYIRERMEDAYIKYDNDGATDYIAYEDISYVKKYA